MSKRKKTETINDALIALGSALVVLIGDAGHELEEALEELGKEEPDVSKSIEHIQKALKILEV